MPVHDWKKVDAGLFHSFHLGWSCRICDSLNNGFLPDDYYALPERRTKDNSAPPITRFEIRREELAYVDKANRIAIRHRHGELVSVIEIVSPGNKNSKRPFTQFVEKAASFLQARVHVMVIDLLPPTKRDPFGIHHEIWAQFEQKKPDVVPGKPLTLVSYDAGPEMVAYVEPIAVGDTLKEMPLFLRPEIYIPCPLESSYLATWKMFPRQLKPLLEGP